MREVGDASIVDELGLIARSCDGDADAFNRLVEQYQRLVYNVALRMIGDAGTAEDVTQDTFVSAYKAIGKFRGGSFKAWLLRIAANCCRDRFRAARRSRSVSLDALMLKPDVHSISDDCESPEDYALRRELGRVITQGLGALPSDQRLVVVLCDIQGFSYEEAAEAAGCSLGTVKSRLSRGRLRLRDFLLKQKELLPAEFRLDR